MCILRCFVANPKTKCLSAFLGHVASGRPKDPPLVPPLGVNIGLQVLTHIQSLFFS